jgi:hypothetical protein
MTPDRLKAVIEHCFRLHRIDGREAHYDAIARFLGVQPITLRRWLRGERPIPRQVELVMTILHHWPEIRAEAVDNAIRGGSGGAGEETAT